MNVLGKFLVLLILVMSIAFMVMSIMVYATHRNWRDAAVALETTLRDRQSQFDQLQSEYNRLETQIVQERTAATQQLSKLETEKTALQQQYDQDLQDLAQLRQDSRDKTAALAVTVQNNQDLAQQAEERRTALRESQARMDTWFASALASTEALHQLKGQFDSLVERSRVLAQQVAGMTQVMEAGGLDPNTPPDAVVPTVFGRVSSVRRDPSGLLIEVTIGGDEGIRRGHEIEIYRGTRYLGRAEVIDTAPDRAVARVNPRFQTGAIQEEDDVATRLN